MSSSSSTNLGYKYIPLHANFIPIVQTMRMYNNLVYIKNMTCYSATPMYSKNFTTQIYKDVRGVSLCRMKRVAKNKRHWRDMFGPQLSLD